MMLFSNVRRKQVAIAGLPLFTLAIDAPSGWMLVILDIKLKLPDVKAWRDL